MQVQEAVSLSDLTRSCNSAQWCLLWLSRVAYLQHPRATAIAECLFKKPGEGFIQGFAERAVAECSDTWPHLGVQAPRVSNLVISYFMSLMSTAQEILVANSARSTDRELGPQLAETTTSSAGRRDSLACLLPVPSFIDHGPGACRLQSVSFPCNITARGSG